MGLFDFLKRKASAPPEPEESFEEFARRLQADFAKNDHLGMAAVAGSKAQAAVASRKFDEAWALYHDQKQHYLQHAARFGFTKLKLLPWTLPSASPWQTFSGWRANTTMR